MSQQFEDVFGYKHMTTAEIARGGQGVVFRTQNPNIAIKIEYSSSGSEFSRDTLQNKRLEEIRLLPIVGKINLTLPQATLKDYAGYAMTLLDDMASFEKVFDYSFDTTSRYSNPWLEQFKESAPGFVNVMAQYLESGGRRRRLGVYLEVACVLSRLHASGLVYCDFSSKNAFVSTVEGNNTVWLIDADNLNYQEQTRHAGYYTPGYGAPEVIKGKGCTFYSDCYAFAVALFWQLTGTHPFKGALVQMGLDDDFADDAEEKAYAGELPWILDTDDTSNFTDARIQQEFVISPRLLPYFDRTFCQRGREKRYTRPTMFEWTAALARELDSSVKCKHCGMDYDDSFDKCPWCDTKNETVRLASKTDKRDIWQYVHELEKDIEITAPLRLVNGFRTDECGSSAFRMAFDGKHFILSDLHEAYEWSVSSDAGLSYTDIYGKAAIPCCCIIRGVSRAGGAPVRIEVKKK